MLQEDVSIAVRDGTSIGARVYRPEGAGPYPALLAAAPYRFDNNILPASPQFLWRETGPIDFYADNGYAYIHMDVRGSGRSAGSFGFLDRKDQEDLYDVIEWIGRQPWCNGRVGGIGQSYFCMLQWFMGAMSPPSLACLGAHDGLSDIYRAGTHHGGIPCDFFPGYWWYQNRFINRYPASGSSRDQDTDLTAMIAAHPMYDDFWRERSAWEVLDRIKVPLYSSGVWAKMQLHTRGNIDGYLRARGPKKLRMSGVPNAWAAAAEFASVDFHKRVLLPFYDHYLKGASTDYLARPNVEYAVRGSNAMRSSDTWPLANVRYVACYLTQLTSQSVTSLNDGGLSRAPGATGATSYSYPIPGWVAGVVGFGPSGPAGGFDPVRRVLTSPVSPWRRISRSRGRSSSLSFSRPRPLRRTYSPSSRINIRRRMRIVPRGSIPSPRSLPAGGCAPRTGKSTRRTAPTWSPATPTAIRSRSRPASSTRWRSASNRWPICSEKGTASGWSSSTATLQ